MKKYNSYKGKITHTVENIIHINFLSNKSKEKVLACVIEFLISFGNIYLFLNIDYFDRVAACSISKIQTQQWLIIY